MSEEREDFAEIEWPNGETRVVPVTVVADGDRWEVVFSEPVPVGGGQTIKVKIPTPWWLATGGRR